VSDKDEKGRIAAGRLAISDEELNGLMEHEFEYITEHFRESDDQLYLMIDAISRGTFDGPLEHTLIMIPEGWPQDDTKGDVQLGLGVKLFEDLHPKKQQLVALVQMTEAWVSIVPEGQKRPDVPPSEDPNRKEIVLCMVESMEGRQARAHWMIERTKAGKRKIKPMEYHPYTEGQKLRQMDNYAFQRIWHAYGMLKIKTLGGKK
jgi:hypothetical protein